MAIAEYDPPDGYSISIPPEKHASILFQWGVRLRKIEAESDGSIKYGFVCLADASCRNEERFIPLSKGMIFNGHTTTCIIIPVGMTSKGTYHLKTKHFVTSNKSIMVNNNKRAFDEKVEYYKSSNLYEVK